jgi:hypothetical protein
MVTRSKAGVFKPNPKYALQMEVTTSTPLPIPTSVRVALRDPPVLMHPCSSYDTATTWRTCYSTSTT